MIQHLNTPMIINSTFIIHSWWVLCSNWPCVFQCTVRRVYTTRGPVLTTVAVLLGHLPANVVWGLRVRTTPCDLEPGWPFLGNFICPWEINSPLTVFPSTDPVLSYWRKLYVCLLDNPKLISIKGEGSHEFRADWNHTQSKDFMKWSSIIIFEYFLLCKQSRLTTNNYKQSPVKLQDNMWTK